MISELSPMDAIVDLPFLSVIAVKIKHQTSEIWIPLLKTESLNLLIIKVNKLDVYQGTV